MKIRNRRIFILSLVIFWIFPNLCVAETVSEGNVTLQVERVLTGANTGTRYYGYRQGNIQLPHNRGGMLSFDLWNDMQLKATAFTNWFQVDMGGNILKIANYATVNQIREEYTQFKGSWGAAGIYRYTLAIPPGVSVVRWNQQGSVTGIELSNVKFTDGYQPLTGGYSRQAVYPVGAPVIQVTRVLEGTRTGRKYYGYQSGTLFFPHLEGGFLTFNVFNDQHTGFSASMNQIHLKVGNQTNVFSQYTTSMDLKEHYKGMEHQWGPAGGALVSIQVPENVDRLEFANTGSQTGIEVANVNFSKGMPTLFDIREHVNRTSEVLKNFTRELHGKTSGRTFYGYAGGAVILPHNKGGVLTFRFWNDHHANTPKTSNQLHISAGNQRQTIHQTTSQVDRREFYEEFPGQWGPAGGKVVKVPVPQGVTMVEFSNSGSDTGFELSDILFSRY